MAFVLEVVAVAAEEEAAVEVWVWEASVVLPSSAVAV
jgi:hypothetical protein